MAWAAFALSFPVWGVVLVVPFLPLAPGEKAVVATASIIVGEALFWSAGLVLGAELLARFRVRWREKRGADKAPPGRRADDKAGSTSEDT